MGRYHKRIWLTGLAMLLTTWALAQSAAYPYVRNYRPREFQASSANYAAVQDGRGLMYFGNYRGVLEYDGANWRLIPVANGSLVRFLARDSVGHIYVGASGEFGRLIPDTLGRLRYESLSAQLPPSLPMSGLVRVLGTRRGAWFQVFDSQMLYRWAGDSLRAFDLQTLGQNQLLHLLGGDLYAAPAHMGLLRWQDTAFVPMPGGDALRGLTPVAITALTPGQYLLRAYAEGFFRLDLRGEQVQVQPWPSQLDQALETGIFSDLLCLQDGHLLVGTFKQGAYVLDAAGKILHHYDQRSGLQDDIVLGAYQDREHSLWLALSRGLSRVEVASPLSHYGEAAGLPGIVYATQRHRGELYAATPRGAFVLGAGGFQPVEGLSEEVWAFFPLQKGQTARLFAASVRGLYEIRDGRGYLVRDDDHYEAVVAGHAPGEVFTLSANLGLQRFRLRDNRWTPDPLPASLQQPYTQLLREPGPAGSVWLRSEAPGAPVLQALPATGGVATYDSSHLAGVQDLYVLDSQVVVLTEQGAYRHRRPASGAKAFEPDTALTEVLYQPGQGISYLRDGYQGRIWVERLRNGQRWLELLRPQRNGYQRDSLIFSALAGVEIWGEVYPEADGQVWVGTPEGLYAYDLTYQRPATPLPRPIIRRIMLGDSALRYDHYASPTSWNRLVELSHHENALTFHFVAPMFDKEHSTRYRYRLLGREEAWSHWTTDLKKEYTLLPPGDYTFEVQARNAFHDLSGITSFSFAILPPWYRTHWAFVSYGVLAIFLVYGMVKLNTHRLYLKNEHLERLVFERTTEIWEQHKEIVKKTVALKRQKEEVAHQRNLLEEKNTALNDAIDRLKATQSQLVESEKMASLGQLTAGVAHEINNPINYVKNNVGPLKRDFTEIRDLFQRIRQLQEHRSDLAQAVADVQAYADEIEADYLFDEMEQLLKGIEEGAMRTKEIVDGLKIFSRSERDTFKLVDLHAGLESTLTLLSHRLKDRIEVQRYFADMPVVECLPGKLNQVFMNVLSNAIQAIELRARLARQQGQPFQGEISLRTEREEGCLPRHRDCVRISIQDNGCGIDPKVQPHIFEPFFTTKEVGEGTGLGLAISFGIVEQHQGRIEVQSERGAGSTFTLVLPFRQDTT